MKKLVLLMSVLASAYCSTSFADELADIKARGSLTCGVLGDLVPLGFQDPKTRSLVGFDVDVCAAVAKYLGVKLELKTVSVDARIPSLVTGRVDLMTASLAYTPVRAKQVDFSSAYISVPVSVLVKKDSGITSFANLAGKKISANRGSTSEVYARQKLKSSEIMSFDDGPSSYLALQQDKVQGMAMVKSAAVGFKNRSNGTTEFLSEPIFWEHDCIGVRKGEPALLAAVNTALDQLDSSGGMQTIWDRWYGPSTEYKLEREKKIVHASDF
ncbi:L-cystine-binding protein FliY [Paraburkholderia nemoris]|uniref:L-cystine-binding protein FliY n=1 Tax=Paraburkholderia nemoris TaxID=2793076 RepID=A0ABM8S4C2_9BURK|nr:MULTISPECIES: ABC transporter substrate-binding protein [Paraburkholderia]CAE6788080.1 L-cystine-binding protein FliY [Paraburkholderia nemoris]